MSLSCASVPDVDPLTQAEEAEAQGRFDEARQWATRAQATEPYAARKLLARVERTTAERAEKQGDLDAAIQALERAIAAEPTPAQRAPDALNAGRLASLQNQPDTQIRFIELALASDPSSVEIRKHAASTFDELGDAERAIRQYLWLWEADRTQTNFASRHAVLSLETGRYADAAAGFKAMLDIDPANVQAALGRFEALHALQRWDEAERQLRDTQARYPDNPGLMVRLADFLDARGKTEEAAKLRKRAAGELPGVKRRKMRKLR